MRAPKTLLITTAALALSLSLAGIATAQDTATASSSSASSSGASSSSASASSSSSTASASSSSSAAAATSAAVIPGKATLVIDTALLNTVLNQHPSSFTGALTSLTVPIGEKLRDKGIETLKARFSDGADTATSSQPGVYDITLTTSGFAYKYDQVSNAGMAITPRVTLTVTADVTSPAGATLLHKDYVRTDYPGATYMMSFHPGQKVLDALDKALGEIFTDMGNDIAAGPAPSPAPAPAPAAAPAASDTAAPAAPAAAASSSSSSSTN